MFNWNHKAKTQINNQSYNPTIWSNIFLNTFQQSIRNNQKDDQKKCKKKKFHIQQLNLVLKSGRWEKGQSQLVLKMHEVCSSRQDQHFWLLDQSISSSYKQVTIEIRKWKSWRILQNFLFKIFFKHSLEGRRRAFKKFQKREELTN